MNGWRRWVTAGLIAAGVSTVMLVVGVMACGPDFEPEIFVQAKGPDVPAGFAEGHLGVVERSYYHAPLVVAYRYLSGGRLGDAEKKIYAPPALNAQEQAKLDAQRYQGAPSTPVSDWLNGRMAYASLVPPPPVSAFAQERVVETKVNGYVERDSVLNCPDAAFSTAKTVMDQRSKAWGDASPEFAEWLRGQDAVFSNCPRGGMMPAPVQAGWKEGLKRDRTYQIAAAKFYAGDFSGAISDFETIVLDKASPWSRWGEYLAARAEIREATASAKTAAFGEATNFDPNGLEAAQKRLQAVEQSTQDAEIRHAAAAELGFVEARLDPAKRLDQVSVALAGPKPDPEFAQDLIDLDLLLDRGVSGSSGLAQWIAEMQHDGALPVSVGTAQSGVAAGAKSADMRTGLKRWQQTQNTAWLVAALAEVRHGETPSAELVAAATGVKPDSPAYATVNFHRTRLLLDAGKMLEARAVATTMLTGMGPETMASTRNSFLAERMRTARTLPEFLADAPRIVIDTGSSAAAMAGCVTYRPGSTCTSKIDPKQFDADGAGDFNIKLPLAVWEEAARSSMLPASLREAVAWAGWMRALGLGDDTAAKRMSELLPAAVRKTAGESDGFPATLALLRNPGMKPFLEQGVQRSVSYAVIESFRDNWWCGKWGSGNEQREGYEQPESSNFEPAGVAAFLSQQQRKDAAEQLTRLDALPLGVVWLGQRAIGYVKSHPEDKDGAEALALVVRATHFGCSSNGSDAEQKAVSKQAFEMLHRLYPQTEWAVKTKYYY